MTRSLQHAGTVTCTIVFLIAPSVPTLSPLSHAIESVSMQRNPVLLNSTAQSDTDAKTFQELVVFSSGSRVLLSTRPALLSSSEFQVTIHERKQEGEVQ